MKCKNCSKDLMHNLYGDSWCEYCTPIDTDVNTCKCGGQIDWFQYVEYWDSEAGFGGNVIINEYRCKICNENTMEVDHD
jgi:hypothetical protein